MESTKGHRISVWRSAVLLDKYPFPTPILLSFLPYPPYQDIGMVGIWVIPLHIKKWRFILPCRLYWLGLPGIWRSIRFPLWWLFRVSGWKWWTQYHPRLKIGREMSRDQHQNTKIVPWHAAPNLHPIRSKMFWDPRSWNLGHMEIIADKCIVLSLILCYSSILRISRYGPRLTMGHNGKCPPYFEVERTGGHLSSLMYLETSNRDPSISMNIL